MSERSFFLFRFCNCSVVVFFLSIYYFICTQTCQYYALWSNNFSSKNYIQQDQIYTPNRLLRKSWLRTITNAVLRSENATPLEHLRPLLCLVSTSLISVIFNIIYCLFSSWKCMKYVPMMVRQPTRRHKFTAI